jgi:threonine dehydrogenase-like Zn-dependent dehydrogenase
MRAVCLDAPRRVSLRDVPRSSPGPDEVLIRVRGCGLCASDLNAWRGVPGVEFPLPAGAPGHEVWGDVVAIGGRVSDRVVGQTVSGVAFNGFAEFVRARADEVLEVPVETLGEPLACAANVVRRAAVGHGQRLALVGFGYLAALVVQLLPRDAGEWIAIARRADSRALARRLGAAAAFDFEAVPAAAWDSFPVVIEAAGVQQTLDYATWLTAPGGRLVIAGYHADGPRTVNMQSWNWKGIDVVNAHERDPAAYVRGLRDGLALVSLRKLELDALLTHRWPLEQIGEAFAALEARPAGFVKAVVCP